ncbi:uncharacterized protein SPPG_09256 [Spizellomyces punctatus DAOM BR117]|uniref:Uncharacterized protein n=1 Tax=Spizellomyces punctatus (strain DAOM BR117) TaxID=645134 RepID=A0A0L0HFE7_SPIPD|nr:uncharacterized protein SPPG_09256 [Spizellomyces punctatus DAOM BR117]KNC99746.1 hypothetical protein SPPG_09256 [Spizellomyces punctatus DAOM BR117]|eukprot:XP_016607786.1 hypothetical protein SPPG_09256 [Spizellomyces punctatus DAOM BR117]
MQRAVKRVVGHADSLAPRAVIAPRDHGGDGDGRRPDGATATRRTRDAIDSVNDCFIVVVGHDGRIGSNVTRCLASGGHPLVACIENDGIPWIVRVMPCDR